MLCVHDRQVEYDRRQSDPAPFGARDPHADHPLLPALRDRSGSRPQSGLRPRLRPVRFFLPLRFPAWIVLAFWVALQWTAAGQAATGPGVAYLAHLVGFGLGFAYAWVRFGGTARVKSAPAPAPAGENQP